MNVTILKRCQDKENGTNCTTRFYFESKEFIGYYRRLEAIIDKEIVKDAYKGLRICEVFFRKPYLRCGVDCEVITL